MNTKTLGQIAYENFDPRPTDPPWSEVVEMKDAPIWEAAATAVIAHHEASKQPPPKFKVGDRVIESLFNSRGVISKADYSNDHSKWLYCIAKPSENYANNIPESYISLDPWTLPAPPAGREWHRTKGWKQEMLPEGYRPLMLHEMTGEECTDVDWMDEYADGVWRYGPEFIPVLRGSGFFRTRRPLPQTHEITITIPPLTLTSGRLSLAAN